MKNNAKEIIFKWYDRSRLDYFDQYINLFIAYNAWFKKVTEVSKDREAITALKSRSGIWQQYIRGETMQNLTPYMSEIVELTDQRPLQNLTHNGSVDPHWNGVVENTHDWESLIEYWYRVRCNLFHGEKSPEEDRESKIVELAYKSLNEFMSEIISRMKNNFSSEDLNRIYELTLVENPDKSSKTGPAKQAHKEYWSSAQGELQNLNDKFKHAQNLWEVDL